MNPLIAIQDHFFRDIEATRARILDGEFLDITNPFDGAVYPAIRSDIPAGVVHEMTSGVEFFMGRDVAVKSIFSRATYAGLVAENKIHSDVVMGAYAAHVYLSREWPVGAGTSFWTNKTAGMLHKPSLDVSTIRTNHIEDWDRYLLVQAALNRLVIHRGDAWHLAEPIGGWGKTPEDGRLVLTAFFD